ncbi:MAG: hypothetical protein QOG67_3553 [Verrucomicrobiota bacterium]|jgi:Tfp pilus assembly protein FimT
MKNHPADHARNSFTLLELLVVIGIIAILLVAIVPAVNSLSKSSGRKSAINIVVGTLEQARSQAIKDGRATYVAFAAQPTDGATDISDKGIIDRYFYHSVAIFEDDPSGSPTKTQLTPWKVLPTGISVRTEISFSSSNAAWKSDDFVFVPDASKIKKFPFVKFNSVGALEAPTPAWSGPIPIRLFEGSVNGTAEIPTTKNNKDETINIARLTGRPEYVP